MSVVSVRIDKKVRETLERKGIDVSSEVKQFLQELAWKAELKERLEKLDKTLSKVPPAQKGFSAKSVREDRESH